MPSPPSPPVPGRCLVGAEVKVEVEAEVEAGVEVKVEVEAGVELDVERIRKGTAHCWAVPCRDLGFRTPNREPSRHQRLQPALLY